MKETLEGYLMGKCVEDTHTTGDMLPDVYNDWIVQQDVEDIIDWAEKWHQEQTNRLIKETREELDETIRKLENIINEPIPNLEEIV